MSGKIINDPVHGVITLHPHELRLVNTPSFQRLRRIDQLGLASFVYPGATHTRFSHSLGVFHITSRALRLLRDRHPGSFDDDEERKLRIAALLHDVGHYPFSHLLERAGKSSQKRTGFLENRGGVAAGYPSHEELGAELIRARSDIQGVLSEQGIEPDEIARIIEKEHANPKYVRLISSTLDFDRMDYLTRDAIATGVPYGRVDIDYLLTNLQIAGDGQIVLSDRAVTAAEQLIVARYFMFKSVYLHKIVHGFEALMRRILQQLFQRGLLWKDREAVLSILDDDRKLRDFCDASIEKKVFDAAEDASIAEPLRQLCRAYRDRRSPRLIYSIDAFRSKTTAAEQPELTLLRKMSRTGLEEAVASTKIDPMCWLIEDSKPIKFEGIEPFISSSDVGNINDGKRNDLVKIINRDGVVEDLVQSEANVVHHLSQLEFQMARVYVVEDDEDKIKKAKSIVEGWCSR